MPEFPYPEDMIISPAVYGRNSTPHEAFAWLRKNDPLRYFQPENYMPFWAATRQEHIAEIEKQPEIFLSAPRPILGPGGNGGGIGGADQDIPEEAVAFIREVIGDSPMNQALGEGGLLRTLIHMDPPDHPKYRDLVQPWFKPSNLKKLEDRLEIITKDILDEMMGDGSVQEMDFVTDLAVYHPLKMLCELLGVPEEDEGLILRLTNEIFAGDDEEMRRDANPMSLLLTIKDLFEYFTAMTENRRKHPTEDLASYIANGKIDGQHLPYKELISYYIIVATAGHDTTRNAMSGGLLALIEHPQELQRFREHPELIKQVVEEIIRWTAPVNQFSRTATRDYELAGKTIKKGDTVGLFYASANRDESVFKDPEVFRVNRKPNKHMSFGSGPHICLGMLLARMELRVFYSQLVPRILKMELAGEPQFLKASFVHGVKHLPIRYQLAPQK
ncbi:MAG: cytochrome P450 [Gammaproteobacteria bacterium]|nr:cytochrome P450 [Gammaproteobacteria bacterium]